MRMGALPTPQRFKACHALVPNPHQTSARKHCLGKLAAAGLYLLFAAAERWKNTTRQIGNRPRSLVPPLLIYPTRHCTLIPKLDTDSLHQGRKPLGSFWGGQPAKVDETLVFILKRAEETQPERLQKMFAAGDKVQLTQGAFAGLEGIYQMADGESRAIVLIEILTKPVHIAVELAELRKLE